MKDQNTMDERILFERREIQSRGYAWVVIILLISVVVQQFFLNAPFKQFAVEFFLFIGCGIYNILANYNKGIDIWNPAGASKKKLFLSTIIIGFVTVIVLAFLSGNYQIDRLTTYFFGYVTFLFGARLIMFHVNKRKQQAIDSALNDDDQ